MKEMLNLHPNGSKEVIVFPMTLDTNFHNFHLTVYTKGFAYKDVLHFILNKTLNQCLRDYSVIDDSPSESLGGIIYSRNTEMTSSEIYKLYKPSLLLARNISAGYYIEQDIVYTGDNSYQFEREGKDDTILNINTLILMTKLHGFNRIENFFGYFNESAIPNTAVTLNKSEVFTGILNFLRKFILNNLEYKMIVVGRNVSSRDDRRKVVFLHFIIPLYICILFVFFERASDFSSNHKQNLMVCIPLIEEFIECITCNPTIYITSCEKTKIMGYINETRSKVSQVERGKITQKVQDLISSINRVPLHMNLVKTFHNLNNR